MKKLDSLHGRQDLKIDKDLNVKLGVIEINKDALDQCASVVLISARSSSN